MWGWWASGHGVCVPICGRHSASPDGAGGPGLGLLWSQGQGQNPGAGV